MNGDNLRILIDLREVWQKQRIAFGARMDAINREVDTATEREYDLIQRYYERFMDVEDETDADILVEIEGVEIIDRMMEVKGIGPMLAARVVCMINIERANTVSALWRYCGYAVIDGKRERPTKGEKLHYNARLKKACYLVGSSFLKSRSPYADVYYKAKEYYTENREWTKAHCHNAAMRKMVKLFLSHLWVIWRTLEGLPVRNLYVEEYLGHTTIIQPEEMGWETVAVVQ